MFQGVYKLWLAVMIMAACVLGCGSGADLLDELPGTDGYSAILTVYENEEETVQIDTVPNTCDEDAEPWSDTLATVTISVDSDATGITLDSYQIEYVPLTDVGVTAPTLTNPSMGYSNTYIGPGASLELPITLVSTDVKMEFNQAMGWVTWSGTDWVWSTDDHNPLNARYYIRVTLYFVTSELELTTGRTTYFAEYLNCD